MKNENKSKLYKNKEVLRVIIISNFKICKLNKLLLNRISKKFSLQMVS